jgi:hypothetical protein
MTARDVFVVFRDANNLQWVDSPAELLTYARMDEMPGGRRFAAALLGLEIHPQAAMVSREILLPGNSRHETAAGGTL